MTSCHIRALGLLLSATLTLPAETFAAPAQPPAGSSAPRPATVPTTRLGTAIAQDLNARSRAVGDAERALALKQAFGAAAEKRALEGARLLDLARKELVAERSRLTKMQGAGTADLAHVYAVMPPKQAALVIAALAPDLQVAVVALLKPRTAAEILGRMPPTDAARLSTGMSGRAASAAAPVDLPR